MARPCSSCCGTTATTATAGAAPTAMATAQTMAGATRTGLPRVLLAVRRQQHRRVVGVPRSPPAPLIPGALRLGDPAAVEPGRQVLAAGPGHRQLHPAVLSHPDDNIRHTGSPRTYCSPSPHRTPPSIGGPHVIHSSSALLLPQTSAPSPMPVLSWRTRMFRPAASPLPQSAFCAATHSQPRRLYAQPMALAAGQRDLGDIYINGGFWHRRQSSFAVLAALLLAYDPRANTSAGRQPLTNTTTKYRHHRP